jgi:PTS system mannose-specific IID component
MTALEFFLISILYFWASSTALSLGVGYYTIYRPVISGFMTGLILGDPFLGMMAGAVVNIIYMNFVSTGGSFKGDQCLTAVVASAALVKFGVGTVEAAAFAYPFGYLGILIWKYRLNINSIFVNKYEKDYEKGKHPDISFYDGLYPQLLLYIMSSIIVGAALLIMSLSGKIIMDHYENIKLFLFMAGMFLVSFSVINILTNLKNKYAYLSFIIFFLIVIIFNISSYWFLLVSAIILFVLSNKNISIDNKRSNKNNNINNKDLAYSWFIWMNFSHSCYSYDRLQGLAFAHSLKNIFKKLYKDKHEVSRAIHSHTEFFNTEPNMGTPIHGYIISIEEQSSLNANDIDTAYIKKGMMGIAAGLGDSYTQVVLTPLFIALSVMMCLDGNYIAAFLPILYLAGSILFISYSGWMNGYYIGREYLIERINTVKNSRVKKHFSYIFSGILGVASAELILSGTEPSNAVYTLSAVALSAAAYWLIKRSKR